LIPSARHFDLTGTHRLIPSKFSEERSVLAEVADTDDMLGDAVLLDGVTNDRIQGEEHGLAGISTFELVYGIPNGQIVNAAFTHTNDEGCRFNDYSRGAWYAAEELETSVAEVAYHKARRLADIVVPGTRYGRPDSDTSTYDDWRADFRAMFHVLEPAAEFSNYLQPEPVPACYLPSQEFARQLLQVGSNGLIYPSVRRDGARCIVCFRPALVYSPRRGVRLELSLTAAEHGYAIGTRQVVQ
jgi:RES domain-containing protein